MGVTGARQKRYPLDPLLPIVERRYRPGSDSQAGPVAKLCAVLGIDRTTAYRWLRDGLTLNHADRAAEALSMHPVNIWPEFHDDIDLELTDDELFAGMPVRPMKPLRKADRRSRRPQPDLEPCGTYAAARRHERDGEELCGPCTLARSRYDSARRDPERERERNRERMRRKRAAAREAAA